MLSKVDVRPRDAAGDLIYPQLPVEFFQRFHVIPFEEPRRCFRETRFPFGNVVRDYGYRLRCYEKFYDVRGSSYLGNEPVVVFIEWVPTEVGGPFWEWTTWSGDLPDDDSVDDDSVDDDSVDDDVSPIWSATSLTLLIWLVF
jgi:hypothetical protein